MFDMFGTIELSVMQQSQHNLLTLWQHLFMQSNAEHACPLVGQHTNDDYPCAASQLSMFPMQRRAHVLTQSALSALPCTAPAPATHPNILHNPQHSPQAGMQDQAPTVPLSTRLEALPAGSPNHTTPPMRTVHPWQGPCCTAAGPAPAASPRPRTAAHPPAPAAPPARCGSL